MCSAVRPLIVKFMGPCALIYANHFIPQTRHDMTPQNACTEQSLCTANPSTVTCNTEDFATSCNRHKPQESNNRSRYNRKQATQWNKRQKVYLNEGSSKPAPSLTQQKLTFLAILTSRDRLLQWFSSFLRCDVFGKVCWTCDAVNLIDTFVMTEVLFIEEKTKNVHN